MFFQRSGKLRERAHHTGILHFAGTCFHVVSLVKFVGCGCFMLLQGVGLLTQVSHQGHKCSGRLHLVRKMQDAAMTTMKTTYDDFGK